MSCDLLPTERPGPHYQGDVRDLDLAAFDLMVAHPPCTHLAVSGARWFAEQARRVRPRRWSSSASCSTSRRPGRAGEPGRVISPRRSPTRSSSRGCSAHGETKATCGGSRACRCSADGRRARAGGRVCARHRQPRPLEEAQPDDARHGSGDGSAVGLRRRSRRPRDPRPPAARSGRPAAGARSRPSGRWTRDGRLRRVPNVGRRVLILTASVEEMVGGRLYDGDDGSARRRHDHRAAGRAAPGGGDDARPPTRVRVRPEVPRPARPESRGADGGAPARRAAGAQGRRARARQADARGLPPLVVDEP
jgi:hypothetical protein